MAQSVVVSSGCLALWLCPLTAVHAMSVPWLLQRLASACELTPWWWHLWLEMFFYEPSHPEPLSMALPRVACFLMGGLFRRGALLLPLLHHGAAGPHGGWDQTPGVDEPTSQTTCTSAWPQPRLTHEQHSLYMAAAWDEDVGLAVQLEDYEMAGEIQLIDDHTAPHPALLPPTCLQSSPSSSSSCTSWSTSSSSTNDWDAILRPLRDGRRLRASMPRDRLSPALLGRDPAVLLGSGEALLPPGSDDPPLRPGSSSSLLSSSLSSVQGRSYCSGETPSPSGPAEPPLQLGAPSSSSSSSSSSTPCATTSTNSALSTSSLVSGMSGDVQQEDEGITQRFNRIRPGRDRWHHPDGSVRNRLREAQAARLTTIQEHDPPLSASRAENTDDGPVIQAKTFYGENFSLWTSSSFLASREDSTTAGSTSMEETGSDSGAASSSDSATANTSVGFWRHGEWVPRPRTAEERRAHLGGNGMQRWIKRERRMAQYLAGNWRPAWLVQYKEDKEKRALRLREISSTVAAGQAPAEKPPQREHEEAELPQWPVSAWTSSGWEANTETESGSAWENSTGLEQWSWTDWWPSQQPVSGPHPDGEVTSWCSHGWQHWEDRADDDWGTWTSWSGSSMSSSSSWSGSRHWDTTFSTSTTTGNSSSDNQCEPPPTTTSTSTTAPELLQPSLPNYGLFPVVTAVGAASETLEEDVEEDQVAMMQLTNSEHRRLQERGVPQNMIQRIENLFHQPDRMQADGRGGESRWSLDCLRVRLVDGIDALDALHEVISRRFLPRGFVPITRVPNTEEERWRMFNWGRNYVDLFVQTLEAHLNTRLQPQDTTENLGMQATESPSAPSAAVGSHTETEAEHPQGCSSTEVASSSGPGRRRATRRRARTSRSRSPTGTSVWQPSLDSSNVVDSQGLPVHVSPRSPSGGPFGPPPPVPANLPWAPTELMGIWQEPQQEESGLDHPSASSTTSSTTLSTPSALVPLCTTLTTSPSFSARSTSTASFTACPPGVSLEICLWGEWLTLDGDSASGSMVSLQQFLSSSASPSARFASTSLAESGLLQSVFCWSWSFLATLFL